MATKKPAGKPAKQAAAKTCPDCGKPIVNGKCACDTGMAKGKGKMAKGSKGGW
jgi:hypothetical protein